MQAYGLGYGLNLISNFTFFLDDPVHGDQVEQVDRRFVTGVRAFQKRQTRLGHAGSVQNTFGVQFRNDDISQIALYHTEQRVRLETKNDASALVTSAGRLRREPDRVGAAGCARPPALRVDGSRFGVTNRIDDRNSGVATAGIVSPKGGVTFGPWRSTEFYVNAGTGFHSNSALGTTIRFDGNGNPADPVTPLVRAKGAEIGVAPSLVPHLQSTVSLWTLRLGSELVYNGDIGATEPGPASKRYGVEFANYYSPKPWLIFDGDLSLSRARFVEFDPAGQVRAGSREHGRLWRRQHRQLPSHLRQPAPALLRSARARPGQLGAVERDDAAQRRGRLPVHRRPCVPTSRSTTCSTPRSATSTTTSPRACRANRSAASKTSTCTRPCRERCASA